MRGQADMKAAQFDDILPIGASDAQDVGDFGEGGADLNQIAVRFTQINDQS